MGHHYVGHNCIGGELGPGGAAVAVDVQGVDVVEPINMLCRCGCPGCGKREKKKTLLTGRTLWRIGRCMRDFSPSRRVIEGAIGQKELQKGAGPMKSWPYIVMAIYSYGPYVVMALM